MRIVEEAARARHRAEKDDQRAFDKQTRLLEDTESCRKRMQELLAFQAQTVQRRKDEAEQAALLKARDMEDKRRKQEQRKRMGEAKEARMRNERDLEEAAEQARQEAEGETKRADVYVSTRPMRTLAQTTRHFSCTGYGSRPGSPSSARPEDNRGRPGVP